MYLDVGEHIKKFTRKEKALYPTDDFNHGSYGPRFTFDPNRSQLRPLKESGAAQNFILVVVILIPLLDWSILKERILWKETFKFEKNDGVTKYFIIKAKDFHSTIS